MSHLIRNTLKALKVAAPLRTQPADPAVAQVCHACREGELGSARLAFLKLDEEAQLRVLEYIETGETIRLAHGLPPYTIARLYERLPKRLGRSLIQALPEGKRHGVTVILDYRRRTHTRQTHQQFSF
ncbi:hypothetical protein [Thiorhodospira sibirica]|uniref:hypothetical protein n=1 Tax=Thiorhodospira sibirica TaxID=154347 RepID=UPI00022C2DF1|nr:hypothetical protein [Thiorhodospira sibirica]